MVSSPDTNTPENLPVVENTSPSVPVAPAKANTFSKPVLVVIAVLVLVIVGMGVFLLSQNNTSSEGGLVPTVSQPAPSGTLIPTNTATPGTTTTVTATQAVSPVLTAPAKVLSKTYTKTVLPWAYRFNYPADWSYSETVTQTTAYSATFAKTSGACDAGEVICAMVFATNLPADIVDPAVSEPIAADESVVLQNEGPTHISTYRRNSTGAHFMLIGIREGWIMANVAPGKDSEALVLFKQILATYSSDEAPEAR